MARLMMNKRTLLQGCARFHADEDGAVTVDWVVLTAAIVGLGIAVLYSVGSAATEYAEDAATCLNRIGIATSRNDGTADRYKWGHYASEVWCRNVR